jgi:hypothetical protein
MKMLVCCIAALICVVLFSDEIRSFLRKSTRSLTKATTDSRPRDADYAPAPPGAFPGIATTPNFPSDEPMVPLSDSRVIASQRMAVLQYPSLAISGEPMQHAFAQEYKRMRARNDPRLQNPDWPMQLAKRVAEAK